MRRRYQKGSVRKVGPSWVGQWWENGHRHNRTLGRASGKGKVTKSDAKAKLAEILVSINTPQFSREPEFGQFIGRVYLPFYKRKWKDSTAETNEYRIRRHLTPEFDQRRLDSIRRDELQGVLDQKAVSGLSFSTVDHLRWDLNQIFSMAVAEGHLQRNPAELLFTPRETPRPKRTKMTFKEVKLLFSVQGLRETLICMLAVIGGLRPGEIFALQWRHVSKDFLKIQQRVYRQKGGHAEDPPFIAAGCPVRRLTVYAGAVEGTVSRYRI